MNARRGDHTGWKPDRVTLRQPPSAREVYWISSPEGTEEPEFARIHPGVIVRGCSSLNLNRETVTFVPVTSKKPRPGPSGRIPGDIVALSRNPNPNDRRPVWAVCSHLYTVKIGRLERYRTPEGPRVGRVAKEDFEAIMSALMTSFGTFRNHVESRVARELELAEARHAAALQDEAERIRAAFEARIEQRAVELLEERMNPSPSPGM